LRQPPGWMLLAIIALGLVAFGTWQIVRAVEDPEGEGTSSQGIAKRIGFAGNAAVQFALAAAATGVTAGWRRAAADDEYRVRDWTGWAMNYPFGRWVVAAIGIGILIY